jgi:hypothetical protein
MGDSTESDFGILEPDFWIALDDPIFKTTGLAGRSRVLPCALLAELIPFWRDKDACLFVRWVALLARVSCPGRVFVTGFIVTGNDFFDPGRRSGFLVATPLADDWPIVFLAVLLPTPRMTHDQPTHKTRVTHPASGP